MNRLTTNLYQMVSVKKGGRCFFTYLVDILTNSCNIYYLFVNILTSLGNILTNFEYFFTSFGDILITFVEKFDFEDKYGLF